MLDKSFFSLLQGLRKVRDFEEMCNLLAEKLPPEVGADEAAVFVIAEGKRIERIFGREGFREAAERDLPRINEAFAESMFVSRLDLSKPQNGTLAVSDFVSPEEYRESEFNRLLHGGAVVEDALIGTLAAAGRRVALISACRADGAYPPAQRERFELAVFMARATAERLTAENSQVRVREFLLTRSVGARVCIFILRPDGEVMPINYDSLRFAEQRWGPDEAFRTIGDEAVGSIREQLDAGWSDPVSAHFVPVEVDLGGGPMAFHALPNIGGEIILITPVPGSEPSSVDVVGAVLTKRQREIMEWIAEGKTSSEVAIILNISPRTVEKHLEAVFQRLGVENRIAAVRRYLDLLAGHPP